MWGGNLTIIKNGWFIKTMAKIKIKVDPKTGVTYFPKQVREEGFTNAVEGLANALTVTFIRPGAKLADVETSLRILLQDIALRRQQGGLWTPT